MRTRPATGAQGARSAQAATAAQRGAALPAVAVSVRWAGGDGAVDLIELARLLAALDGSGRVAAAARELGVSYRTVWGRLTAAERVLGQRLVERVRGHGSRLTPAGRELVAAGARFERHARTRLAEPLASFAARVGRLGPAGGVAALRLAASHDLLLQRCLAERRITGVNVRFVGSAGALEALARGEAELAGFHRPAGERRVLADALAGGLPLFVVPLVVREQGLIVAAGNPLRIRDVTDLARPGLRFVNRQRGAGTRAWFDRLLQQGGIAPQQVAGYEVEEPSHLAVAASVAAGEADAGFGLRAAADRFGLGFVSVGHETYWLAGMAALRRDRRVVGLLAEVARLAVHTPGYAAPTLSKRRSA